MAKHQHDENADELWTYFQNLAAWVRETFPTYRKQMKDVDWGPLYNEFNSAPINADDLETEITKLIQGDDVTSISGIYPYVLTRQEKYLNLRSFDDKTKLAAYERQKGICVKCTKHFDLSEMEADHITPWHEGGKTVAENCQMLCKQDNRTKSGK